MISLRARLVRALLRLYTYPARMEHRSLSRSVRFRSEKYRPPRGYAFSVGEADGVRTEILQPPEHAADLLHFHGGGHTVGIPAREPRRPPRRRRLFAGDMLDGARVNRRKDRAQKNAARKPEKKSQKKYRAKADRKNRQKTPQRSDRIRRKGLPDLFAKIFGFF